MSQLPYTDCALAIVFPMQRRMEDKIRQLCWRAIAEQDPVEFERLVAELRAALHAHIQSARKRLAALDLVERRVADLPAALKNGEFRSKLGEVATQTKAELPPKNQKRDRREAQA